MSAEDILNQPAADVERAPSPDSYTPMGDAFAPPSEPEKVWDGPSDTDNVKAAADERIRSKRDESEPIERRYIQHGGEHDGEPVPMNQELSLDRAATDLDRQRNFEQVAAERSAKDSLALQVDLDRLGITDAQLEQAREALQQQQQQPEFAPQPEPEIPEGIDPEVFDAISKSPKLRAALEETAQQVNSVQQEAAQAREQYAAATQNAHAFAIQSMVAAIPELAGLHSPEQISAALQVLQASSPQRHAAAVQHLHRVDALGKQAAAVQQQRHQQVQAQVHQWAVAEDKKVDEYLAKNESPETVRAVKDNLPKILTHYGVDVQEFKQAIQQNAVFRSAPFQKMLFQVGKQFVLQEQVAAKVSKPVPNVQRPGVSQPMASYADSELAEAKARFLKNPDDPKLAAAFITAKRNARG